MSSPSAPAEAEHRELEGDERRTLALLGLPTFALALSMTMVTTYGPTVASSYIESSLVIGLVIGAQGLLALWLPLVVGAWSDRLRTGLGGRLPFLLAGLPPIVGGLLLVGIAGSAAVLIVGTLVFFTGYFLAYEPYRALYPDAVPDDIAGRAQGTQAVWRGAGTGITLLAGGLLLEAGEIVPFALTAVVCAAAIGAFAYALVRRGVPDQGEPGGDGQSAMRHMLDLLRGSPELRAFLVANALWELSVTALSTFVVLYVSKGLGFSTASAGLIIGVAALGVLVAALVVGNLADRHGPVRVMRGALILFGLGLLVPFLFAEHWLVAAAVPFVAAGGGALTALPYAILTPLMDEGAHGTLSGFFSFSRGLGIWLGPLLAGLSIGVLDGVFESTQGYQALWLPVSAAALLSLLPLRRLARAEREMAASG